MLNQQHIKSLELLSKFIADTPKEQLDIFIKKYEDMGIEGPTFSQYKEGLEDSFCGNNLLAHGKRIAITPVNYGNSITGCLEQRKSLPPPQRKKISNSNPTEYVGFPFLHTFAL